MDKFTVELHDDEEIEKYEHEINNNVFKHFRKVKYFEDDKESEDTRTSNKNKHKNSINSSKSNNSHESLKEDNTDFIETNKYPVQFLCSEILDGDLFNLKIREEKATDEEWLSYLFQTISALTVAQRYYKLYNNDLHSSNVMYKNTDREYLYYKTSNNRFYKVPTFGRIIKIIDWGRSTFKFDNHSVKNNIFNSDGICFSQYIYDIFKKNKKDPVDPNPSMDLSLLASDLLNEEESTNIPLNKSHTKNLLREFLKDRQNNYIDFFDDESFDTYIRCARDACNAVPKNQFSKNCFKMFSVNPKHIPKNEIIYPIPN